MKSIIQGKTREKELCTQPSHLLMPPMSAGAFSTREFVWTCPRCKEATSITVEATSS